MGETFMSYNTVSSLETLCQLSQLRWLVAFLGSKKNAAWWDCSFMDETGVKFMANCFPRTALAAAAESTTEAAQRVHDSALGRIGCYHLFRLPVQIEERLHETNTPERPLPSKDAALEELASMADASIDAPEGPVQMGLEKKLLTTTSLRELAAHYHSAFSKGIRCYPYFSVET